LVTRGVTKNNPRTKRKINPRRRRLQGCAGEGPRGRKTPGTHCTCANRKDQTTRRAKRRGQERGFRGPTHLIKTKENPLVAIAWVPKHTIPTPRSGYRKRQGRCVGANSQKTKTPGTHCECAKRTRQSARRANCRGRGGNLGANSLDPKKKKTPEWPITATRGFC